MKVEPPELEAPPSIPRFRRLIRDFFRRNGRSFPWRETNDPYAVLVSEYMLQQTQTGRVLPKYADFLVRFPKLESLAAAGLGEVLAVWQGLGYNRRAKALREAAGLILERHAGRVPAEPELLERLPGIGPYTARAVSTFAYNRPNVFVETNIRSVFIHFFFPGGRSVPDREILPLIETSLDRADPRAWYSGLMDYGAWLKKTHAAPARRSGARAKQPGFEGSRRQLRGRILKAVLARGRADLVELGRAAGFPERELRSCLEELVSEGLIAAEPDGRYRAGD
jgi:A/G-specific adenine glycosylase